MSAPRRLATVSVAEAATDDLRERLFAGEFHAGEEIKDTRIAESFGIARPTARVAVQQLINEGMLVRPPGYSARVRTFDPEQVEDIYRARKLIELDAVREITRQDLPLDRITAALTAFSKLRGSEDDWTRIAAADVAFHTAIVDTANSAHLRAFFAAITSEIRLLIALLKTQYTGGNTLFKEHEELYRCLTDGSPWADIEAHWLAHLNSAEAFLKQHLA